MSRYRKLFGVSGVLSILLGIVSLLAIPSMVLADGNVAWTGNGSDASTCTVDEAPAGYSHWVFTTGGNDSVTGAVLTVDGVDYTMTQHASGSWYANVPGGVPNDSASVAYVGDLGSGNAVVTISCLGSSSSTPEPSVTPTPEGQLMLTTHCAVVTINVNEAALGWHVIVLLDGTTVGVDLAQYITQVGDNVIDSLPLGHYRYMVLNDEGTVSEGEFTLMACTTPPTSTVGSSSDSSSTPLVPLGISLAFGLLGLTAVLLQRRSLARR